MTKLLSERFCSSGGVSRLPEEKESVVSTAWATLALCRISPGMDQVSAGRHFLSRLQQADGSVPVAPEIPDVIWPTPVALLAWGKDNAFCSERRKATRFLLECQGVVLKKKSNVNAHDGRIPGWPWVDGTYSWVEPTALAILALKSENQEDHPRVKQGINLLLDRMLVNGGWNYGNKNVFGTDLMPMPESTGIALCALQGDVPEKEIETSLSYLTENYPRFTTPLSLARSVSGLSAFHQRPVDAEQRIENCLDLQKRYGPFETPLLAELGIALDGGYSRQ